MRKEQLLEYLKSIRCNSRGKTGTEVATECIALVSKYLDIPSVGKSFKNYSALNRFIEWLRAKKHP